MCGDHPNVSLTRIYVYFFIFMLFDIVEGFEHNMSTVFIFFLRIPIFFFVTTECHGYLFLDYHEVPFLCVSCNILFLSKLITLVSEKHVKKKKLFATLLKDMILL